MVFRKYKYYHIDYQLVHIFVYSIKYKPIYHSMIPIFIIFSSKSARLIALFLTLLRYV